MNDKKDKTHSTQKARVRKNKTMGVKKDKLHSKERAIRAPLAGGIVAKPLSVDFGTSPVASVAGTGGATFESGGTVFLGETVAWVGATENADKWYLSGSLGIGTTDVKRTLQVEGQEIHSGGPAGGFSFGNRGSSFVEIPSNGERWVWYSHESKARLWSGTDKLCVTSDGNVGIGTYQPNARLTIQTPEPYGGNTLRIESKNEPQMYYLNLNTVVTNSVVRWVFDQTNAGTNFPNVLAFDRGNVGIGTAEPQAPLEIKGGSGGQFQIGRQNIAFEGGNESGNLHIESKEGMYLNYYSNKPIYFGSGSITIGGTLAIGADISLAAGHTLSSPGRMHVSGEEYLFLLNKSGVIVSKVWGGNGNLTVEGNITVGGTFQLNGGAVFNKFQSGTNELSSNFGPGTDKGSISYSISFPEPFSSVPRVIVTARDLDIHPDIFAVSTKGINENGFSVNVRRLDNGSFNMWGLVLYLDWLAWT